MSKRYRLGDATLYAGDCLDVLAELDLVDAVVTDPPYGLEFMGKEWDRFRDAPRRVAGTGGREAPFAHHAVRLDRKRGQLFGSWCETWAQACYGALRPGGFLLAFGGTRTQHRMVCAIEDAGFVIQDTIAWLYGTGFPKSKALFKPAFEPIVVAYKPGGKRTLQVDECRIPTSDKLGGGAESSEPDTLVSSWDRPWMHDPKSKEAHASRGRQNVAKAERLGRWPANVILSYPDDEYILRDDVTPAQKQELYRWMSENT
jgi:hypothetical protein